MVRKYLIFINLLILSSCSTKNDFFINRAYRYVVLKYNVTFNGQEAIKKYEESIQEDYQEDFFHFLPLEIKNIDKINPSDSLLKKAENKARIGISKHSMLINNNERNNYIDRAYLLLGKSLYYQEEYNSAIETFSYAKSHLRGFKEWINCCIWLERSNIANGRYGSVEDFLKALLKEPNLTKSQEKEIYKLLSESNIKNEDYQKAETYLNNLISKTSSKKERHRYTFILAQVLMVNNKKEKLNATILKLKSENCDYTFIAQGELLIASSSNISEKNYTEQLKPLFKIIKDKKYDRPENMIFYVIADVYYKAKMIDSSLFYVNKSIEISRLNGKLFETGIAYHLAEKCYFEKGDYINAMKSCDDGIIHLKNRTIDKDDMTRLQRLITQKKNLHVIVKYINSYQEKDILILLCNIPKENIENFITEKTQKELEDDEEKENRKYKKNEEEKPEINDENMWYFYNKKVLSLGLQNYKNHWGNRKLIDNWRNNFEEIMDTAVQKIDTEEPKNLYQEKKNTIIKERINYLTSKLPKEQKELEKLINDRNYEYYSVAILYRDQFKRPDLCIKQLEKLLNFEPFEELRLPAFYFLYKSYNDIGDVSNAEKYKNIILQNYKESRYAFLIQGDNSIIKTESTDEKLYANIYNGYINRDTSSVIKLSEEFERNFHDSKLSVKVNLILASVFANSNIEKYIEKLDFILFNYPGTKEADEAFFLKEKALSFSYKNKDELKYVLSIPQYIIILSDNEKYLKAQGELNFIYQGYDISFIKNQNTSFILIKTFKDKSSAVNDLDFFIKRIEGLFTKNDIFVFSKLDYERLIESNSLESILKTNAYVF